MRSGISTGGQYNSSEGCKPYTITKCDHHVTGMQYNIYSLGELCMMHESGVIVF